MAIQWLWVILLSLAVSMAIPSNGEKSKDMLLDTEGDPLEAGQNYFVMVVGEGNGRGLALTKTCPQYVVQDKHGDGLPMLFHPICNQNTSVFLGNTAVHVAISGPSICGNNTGGNGWSMERVSRFNQTLVKISSGEGQSFRISKIGDDAYGLFWCPAVICEAGIGPGPSCIGLGIHNGFGVVAGGLQPLRVQFKKFTS
ncbi:hypothetical protein SUGI_0391120 [Cryptomeria japonica]|nr:hypothetical protein SUGI_0391120 [Cryptomeria japonica]